MRGFLAIFLLTSALLLRRTFAHLLYRLREVAASFERNPRELEDGADLRQKAPKKLLLAPFVRALVDVDSKIVLHAHGVAAKLMDLAFKEASFRAVEATSV